jgi:hypothetical protein
LPGQRGHRRISLPQWALNLAARGRLAYSHNGGRFMVTKPIDGKPATTLNGGTIGFLMSDAKQAEAWHNAGVANGGTWLLSPPGRPAALSSRRKRDLPDV